MQVVLKILIFSFVRRNISKQRY